MAPHPERGNPKGAIASWLRIIRAILLCMIDLSKIEYGLGIVLTLFNDILQIGYGINLQTQEKRGYFFIGASLFDLLSPLRAED